MDVQLILIVAAFSIIQSVFGMGLLVFGTPTLLLMGYPFAAVLSILLPPSLTISAIQLFRQERQQKRFAVDLLTFCLPILVLALAWTFISHYKVNLRSLIAAVLIFTAVSRFSSRISGYLRRIIENNSRKYLLVMGCVHGLSNMGGSLLSAYAVTRHQMKQDVLGCIVTGYLLFGIVQLGTLHYVNALNLNATTFACCTAAAAVYLLVGNRLFKSLNEQFYQHIFSAFMLVYAALMIFL
ncbi:hypothetical protein COO59_16375 [Mixta theicola]|uniref:Probable membrane transporter protein n=1 Tax=Mixta theicola TaxID=1458355 RepID=A0A2K1Q6R2_9GAMM|nr:TSUP family transporter [Mixta theicola]PNS10688.1 hypothetical protein COO59_16375 [Mixta theicola]GLR10922.1 hypothetical protein GCM10007905_36420 [Mixta theicola]